MITNKKINFWVILLLLLAWPVSASEVTGGLSNQGVVPILPSGVVATKTGDQQITISWNAVVGVDGYRIYQKKDSADFQLLVDNLTNLQYVNSSLANGNYSYRVQSFKGSLSPSVDNTAPTAPITINFVVSTPTPTPTPSGGGGGGGGGGGSVSTPTPTPTGTPTLNQGNSNGDGKVDVLDFNTLVTNWGATGSGNSADFNSDGTVDILDFNILMNNWS